MKKWLLLAVVGLMSACSKSDIEEVNASIGAESPIFYASLEGSDETRTYLDANQKMRWTTDDRVTIFFGENYNREFAFTGETGSTAGSFNQKSTDGFYTAEKVTANYAVYPHQASTQLEVEGYFKFSLPATQSYAENSFGLNANTMVAVTKTVDDRFLQFKNVCGYLKLNLYGANVTVKSITLTGNNEEPLAGAATVTPTYGGNPSMAWAASGTTTSLTLDCGDGVKIGATEAEATPFWLVVPPTTFTKGFTVTITDTAGNTFTKSSTSKQTITRNISKNMPAFEIAPTGPANNEIWYTSTDGKIVEPHSKDAFGVAIKSNTYENGKGMITFDGNVKRIGEDAFHDCESLASIIIPEGVTTIGASVFRDCTSLASITLPESVTRIESYTFESCRSLASITIPEGITFIGDKVFYYCTSLTSITLPEGVTTIGRQAFYRCTSLASIIIPEGVTTIRESAFYGCSSLKSITLPEGVTTIGENAFSNCTSLQSITIPEGVTTIGEYAFRSCKSLTSIIIPEGVTTIEYRTFEGCKSLKRVDISDIAAWCKISFADYLSNPMNYGASLYLNGTLVEDLIIPDEITEIKQYAFWGCASLKSITIPEGITEIGQGAFWYCTSLASITLPEGLTTIGDDAFWYCSSLASITLPEGLTTIGNGAFAYCTSLASITLPEGLTTIEGNAFWNCTSLASITLPEGVTEIGFRAFGDCTSLKSVYCKPITPPTGYSYMFSGNAPGRKIYVPAGSVNAYKAAVYWSDYADAIVGYDFEKGEIVEEVVPAEPANNEIWYTSTDGNIVTPYKTDAFGAKIVSHSFNKQTCQGILVFDGDVKTIGEYAFYMCKSLASITLPEGVTEIGDSAFSDCTNLSSASIPENLTTIGRFAFGYCTSLASITIPEGVTTIRPYAFYRCTSLANITLSEGVTTIEEGVFRDCTSLASITLPEGVTSIGVDAFFGCTRLASVTLPKSITEIERQGFCYCSSLTSITLPEGLTTIGAGAFAYCTSLASINIPEGVTEIEDSAFYACTSLKSITLPEGLTTIGAWAFRECTSLASVYCKPTTPPIGGDYMFSSNASGRKIYVPAKSVAAYKAAEYWEEYAPDIVAEE